MLLPDAAVRNAKARGLIDLNPVTHNRLRYLRMASDGRLRWTYHHLLLSLQLG